MQRFFKVHVICHAKSQWRIEMDIQTSDALYRRHENEWAAFRDAVQQKEASQKRGETASGEPFSGNKASGQE
jgi:hypothetical protein